MERLTTEPFQRQLSLSQSPRKGHSRGSHLGTTAAGSLHQLWEDWTAASVHCCLLECICNPEQGALVEWARQQLQACWKTCMGTVPPSLSRVHSRTYHSGECLLNIWICTSSRCQQAIDMLEVLLTALCQLIDSTGRAIMGPDHDVVMHGILNEIPYWRMFWLGWCTACLLC